MKSLMSFIKGEIGIYKSFFLYLIVPFFSFAFIYLGLAYTWVTFENKSSTSFNSILNVSIDGTLNLWILVSVITSFGVLSSAVRSLLAKEKGLIDKGGAVFITITLLGLWFLYGLSLYFPID